jgi:hypothetical protein
MRYPRLLEAAILAAALTTVAAIVYGPNAIHGGFISDAWTWRAIYELAPGGDGFLGATDYLLDQPNMRTRPLYAIYFAVLNWAFGPHMGFWLANCVALGVLMSVSLYVLLRELALPRLHAGTIAALVLVFPAAGSLRLWTASPASQLTIALAMLGLVAALRAFGSEGRRRMALHGISLALFAISVLLYEIALPVLLASVLVYRLRAPWGTAARRWLVDCALLVPLALLALIRSPEDFFQKQDSGGVWHHAGLVWDQAVTLLTTVVLPFGSDRWYVVGLIALIPATAGLVARRLPTGDPARMELRRWLGVVLAGLCVVALGYAVFLPVQDTYSPMGDGVFDRVNAVPSIGWTLIAYGTIALAATLAFRGLPRARDLASGLTVLVCVVLGVGWIHEVRQDADRYMRAYGESRRVLDVVGGALPDPRPGSTIWTFGQPREIAPGFPVFTNFWEMTDAVRLTYHDPTMASYVGYAGTTFECGPDEIAPRGHPQYELAGRIFAGSALYVDSFASPYGRTYFVDTKTGRSERIDTPRQCRRASASFPRSPA